MKTKTIDYKCVSTTTLFSVFSEMKLRLLFLSTESSPAHVHSRYGRVACYFLSTIEYILGAQDSLGCTFENIPGGFRN